MHVIYQISGARLAFVLLTVGESVVRLQFTVLASSSTMLPQQQSQTSGWGQACLTWVRERLGTNSLPSRIPPIPPLESFAPHTPQLQEAEVNQLSVRQQLLDYVDEYIFNNIPTHLLRMSDMKLVTRNEIWETVRPRIEADIDAALTELSSLDIIPFFMDQWFLVR